MKNFKEGNTEENPEKKKERKISSNNLQSKETIKMKDKKKIDVKETKVK